MNLKKRTIKKRSEEISRFFSAGCDHDMVNGNAVFTDGAGGKSSGG